MAEIIKIYKQLLPATRFVGMKYGDEDRVNGSYGYKWEEWFSTGRFTKLETLIADDFQHQYEDHDSYVGLMRCKEGEPFEYWIGMFLPADAEVPEGFSFIDLESKNLGVCWIYGREPDIYCKEEDCAATLTQQGYEITTDKSEALWCFERYGCPRFTSPDGENNVVLDICYFIQ